MKSVKITYFVHGTTTDNLSRRSTGWLPGELSELGIKQSEELKNLANLDNFDAIFCSDLKRAIDSAYLNFGKNTQIIQDERLRECNYGDLNGMSSDQVIDEDHVSRPFPNGESLLDVEKRIRSFCGFLLDNYNEKHIAIVAHKAPQLAFEVITQGKSWEQALSDDWRKRGGVWQPGWNYELK